MSSLPNSNHSNNYFRLLTDRYVQLFLVGVAIGSGVGYGFRQNIADPKRQEPIIQNEIRRFSRAEYERLQLGMRIAEVEAILGRGTEIQRSTTIAIFIWENWDTSKITVTFETGKLKRKEQLGLK
ncbi:hypothetical protein ACQFX9_24605 [Aliinostoc sp. HNIBRCY26]|uniref:hypothetical protein n=1 Tax=Aliinostoc sp. HNIBRCY26 TaxID=3418997 RepID=UPI003D00784B